MKETKGLEMKDPEMIFGGIEIEEMMITEGIGEMMITEGIEIDVMTTGGTMTTGGEKDAEKGDPGPKSTKREIISWVLKNLSFKAFASQRTTPWMILSPTFSTSLTVTT